MANLRDLSNVACIVGVDESDEMGTLPHKSQLSLRRNRRRTLLTVASIGRSRSYGLSV